jgi:RND family efflux transporter MFP subunit
LWRVVIRGIGAARALCLVAFASGLVAASPGCSRSRAAELGHDGGARPASAAPGPPPMPVEIDTVRATTLRETSEYVATLRSRRSIQVQPQVEGHLLQIFVTSGDRVAAGAPLMLIDPARQRAAVDTQHAAREANLAAQAYWRRQYRRIQRLVAGGAASRQELEQTESSLRQAEANVLETDAQKKAQTVELRYYSVKALGGGTVGDIPVRVGDYVTPQTLLTTVDDNQVLEAYVEVPIERASRVAMGMPVEIVDGAGKVLADSQVTFISPRAAADTQTLLVKTRVENRDGRLRTAQVSRARVIWGQRQGPVVPVLAVQSRNGQTFAWVVREAAPGALAADQRAVDVGPIEGQSYPVLRGLKAGDRIVVSGVQKLRPGARVVAAKPAGGHG